MPPIDEWLTFIHTSSFDESWIDLGLTDEDLARMQAEIVENPDCGDVVGGTGGLRKLRFAPEGSGKSGGCRGCFASFAVYGIVILVLDYGKREKADLSAAGKKAIAQLLKSSRRSSSTGRGMTWQTRRQQCHEPARKSSRDSRTCLQR